MHLSREILMPIPWDQVILHGPKVLDAATSIFDKWKTRPRPQAINPEAEVQTQLTAIAQRLQALEEAQTAQTEVAKDMAQQIQSLSAGFSDLSKKTALALWLAAGALLLSATALIAVFVRT